MRALSRFWRLGSNQKGQKERDKEDLGIWSLGAWEKEAKRRKPSIEVSVRKEAVAENLL